MFKRKKNLLVPFLLAIFVLTACTQAPDAPKAKGSDPQPVASTTTPATATQATYKVDLAKSVVNWVGTKPTSRHNGTINISDGSFNVDKGEIKTGSFTLDINSIAVTDLTGDKKADLESHLKDADFFDAGKFPAAKFEITGITAQPSADKKYTHNVSGNMTIKDITKNISFPANIKVSDTEISAQSEFNILRTDFGMTYKSDKSLGDKLINPEVNLALNITARK